MLVAHKWFKCALYIVVYCLQITTMTATTTTTTEADRVLATTTNKIHMWIDTHEVTTRSFKPVDNKIQGLWLD